MHARHPLQSPTHNTLVAHLWRLSLRLPATFNASPPPSTPLRHLQRLSTSLEPDPRAFILVYGRRIRYVADNVLFITTVQALAVFDIKPADVLPEVGFQPGVLSHPLPYECWVVPRSETSNRLVEGSMGRFLRGEGGEDGSDNAPSLVPGLQCKSTICKGAPRICLSAIRSTVPSQNPENDPPACCPC
ncbi:hypothetical protein P171DRAFT_426746 [Karstenula rhodostoma CBS 690.94]|uniref:Uncharacterized protein n=1 Tax=Karstenula rhodostoma CBS 690.94 TaxID=1392251 RepID=A0A9P4PVZ1_9PLEO|nr:hypothetical protein P171DRAFT_426746 [Karstenula rhodostoma CBS 690.94]